MAYHPAEFARKGYALLQQISKDFYTHKDDWIRLRELFAEYDKKVERLYRSRLNWSEKDYLLKNIESFIIGSIGSMVIVLIIVVLIEHFAILELTSIGVTLKIYLTFAVAGGVLWAYVQGPKFLTEEERDNTTIMELYESAKQLKEKYEKLKKFYKPKKTDLKQTDEKQGETSAIVTPELAKVVSVAQKKEKRKWGLSEQEREERRNILSLRFLMKVARLKETSLEEEEREYHKPLVVILEPDIAIANHLTEILKVQYDVLAFQEISALLEHTYEYPPDLIIAEAEIPGVEYFGGVEMLNERFDMERSPMVVFTIADELDSLIKAKELKVVDYWIKEFDNDNKFSITPSDLLGKISGILGSNRSSFSRQLDRRIRRKQFQELNEEAEIVDVDPVVMIVSTDYLLISYLQDELEKFGVKTVGVNNPQNIFATAVVEKPDILLLDETIAPEGVLNICKMLNIRLSKIGVVLIVDDQLKFDRERKAKDLRILKRFSRPFINKEILDYLINQLKLELVEVNAAANQSEGEKH